MAAPSAEGLQQDISPEHYTIERELGRGGMATVYVARDTKHSRRVALKVLRPELAASLGAERFRREITLAANLQHPHIVSVHDSGETPSGVLWFTMPLIEGESLRDRLRRQHQLSVEESVRITREVALALDYAHRHGVIHRDIKPENILLVDGQPLVADFGIARAIEASAPGETLTATGMALGTPAYMSPEQAAGERALDAATDIYSLGAVCYEMLTGEPPFPGPTAQAIAAKMRSGDVPSIRRVRPSVPEAVEEVVRAALAPVPADRYGTAGELAKALESAERTAFRSGSRPARTRTERRWPIISTGALGLLLFGAAGLFWKSRQGVASAATGPVRIAVLPFENLGDNADRYFADGMTDEVRGKLAALSGLEVIASASSNQYRNTTKTPDQIGRELGVRYLLVGRVRWDKRAGGGSRVRVEPELVEVSDVKTPTSKWQEPFDAPFTDVFDVQANIATQVARELRLTLSPAAEQGLAARPTQNLDAYDAYLRGKEAWQRGDDLPSLRPGIDALRESVTRDSMFASAWAELGKMYASVYGEPLTHGFGDSAHAAIARALTLSPNLPEALNALSFYYVFVSHDRAGEIALDSVALAHAANSAPLLSAAATTEGSLGHWEQAVSHFEQAARLDPRNALGLDLLGASHGYLGQYPAMDTDFHRALALEPGNLRFLSHTTLGRLMRGDVASARAVLHAAPETTDEGTLVAFAVSELGIGRGWMLDSAQGALLLTLQPTAFENDRGLWGVMLAEQYVLRGDRVKARAYADSARSAIEIQLESEPQKDPSTHELLGLALAYLGRKDDAVREAERGAALLPVDGWFDPFTEEQLAQIYVLVGQPDKAVDVLERLLKPGGFLSPAWLRIDPHFAPLHGNPRFEKLIATSLPRSS